MIESQRKSCAEFNENIETMTLKNSRAPSGYSVIHGEICSQDDCPGVVMGRFNGFGTIGLVLISQHNAESFTFCRKR
jgi:hypothetical protein